MHQGNWKCSSCGGAINELPFEPRSESGLTCRTCYAKQKDQVSSNEAPDLAGISAEAPSIPDEATPADGPPPVDNLGTPTKSPTGDKPKFTGDWKCATCGATIDSLPFEPRSTNNLKCIDCFKNNKT